MRRVWDDLTDITDYGTTQTSANEKAEDRKRTCRAWLFIILLASILTIFVVMYVDLYRSTPGRITILAGHEQQIDLNIPLQGRIAKRNDYSRANDASAVTVDAVSSYVNFSEPVSIYAGEPASYIADVKVFGIIPFKQIRIDVIDNMQLIPGGVSIGIYMKTTGVYVEDCATFENAAGKTVSPCQYIIRGGDVILAANDQTVEDNKQFIELVEQSGGEPILLTIRRADQEFVVKATPQKNEDGKYRLGIWIKDSAQGIGTLTYVRPDHSYGALGHGISDKETENLIPIESGNLLKTQIVDIRKGIKGEPGELTGVIRYTENNVIGSIRENTDHGIYGVLDDCSMELLNRDPMPIATSNEMECGPATILCMLEGEIEEYDITVERINRNNDVSRGLTIRVTDERLLELAGGIVQGMSGSPIIQNGKLIGAVTHVLVNDPTKGYGIFIEEMLKQ